MEHIFYIVKVHDIGEVYNYEYTDLARAKQLLSGVRLECSLWECDRRTGRRLQLESHGKVS